MTGAMIADKNEVSVEAQSSRQSRGMREIILVVDDDPNLLRVTGYQLAEGGYEVMTASSAERGLKILETEPLDLLLTDVRMPDMDGLALLEKARVVKPGLPVIFITAYAAIDSAVDAIKSGATDYIPKPFKKDDLLNKVSRALEVGRLKQELAGLKQQLARREGLDGLVGKSEAMRKVFDLVTQVAASDSTVLIQGESGTGKELLARAIHRLSHRANGPLVAINCAAIPRELLESELFGHVRGAFTGAIRDRVGVFQQANGGTLFLDEVGDISIELQPKLLRVLQEREVGRVGGGAPERIDVRVVAATQADLKAMVRDGRFREDLFYRLHVIPIELPPLRERKGDVPRLVAHLIEKHFPENPFSFSTDAMALLENYSWPGNVREMENLIERLGVTSRGKEVGVKDLPIEMLSTGSDVCVPSTPRGLREAERDMIVEALKAVEGNRSAAARRLGIPRHILLYRLKKYNIQMEV